MSINNYRKFQTEMTIINGKIYLILKAFRVKTKERKNNKETKCI